MALDIDHLTVTIGAIGAAIAATFGYLNRRRVAEVHQEVTSTNGSTTAQAVQDIHESLPDVREAIVDLHDIAEDTRDRVTELTAIVAHHLSDGHGPKLPTRPSRRL